MKKTEYVGVRMEEAHLEDLRRIACDEQRSVAAVIRIAVEELLTKREAAPNGDSASTRTAMRDATG